MLIKEYENDPKLGRPVTWAERFLLKYMWRYYPHHLYPVLEPYLWPKWLVNSIMRPLLKAGYVTTPDSSPFTCYRLTDQGISLWSKLSKYNA